MYIYLICVLCLALAGSVHGYGSGAPDNACASEAPGHTSQGSALSGQSGNGPFTVSTSKSTYTVGEAVDVTITGGDYAGMLLQARKKGETDPQGTWSDPPADTKLKTCSNDNDSVTHGNTNTKNNTAVFTWNAPDEDAGTIVFVSTIAVSHDVYYIQVMSIDVIFDSAGIVSYSTLTIFAALMLQMVLKQTG